MSKAFARESGSWAEPNCRVQAAVLLCFSSESSVKASTFRSHATIMKELGFAVPFSPFALRVHWACLN